VETTKHTIGWNQNKWHKLQTPAQAARFTNKQPKPVSAHQAAGFELPEHTEVTPQ
jgi:hypothetical protein